MERIFKDSRTIQRYTSGPLSFCIQQLVERLCQQGYTREQAHKHVYTADDFARWLHRRGTALRDATVVHARQYLDLDHRWKKHGDWTALKRLLEMLAQLGLISPTGTRQTQAELVVHQFGSFLSEQRALVRRTINNRKTIVTAFVAQRLGKRSFQFSNIKAEDLIAFVQKEAIRRRNSIKTVESALRSFMRYLLFVGYLDRDLSIAVPSAPNRRFVGIPRNLTADQVSRVLGSCNRQTSIGRRDYAILLLLARLGLRAGEVEGLKLDDIDWTAGTLTVHGKGGKAHQMPLLHDVWQSDKRIPAKRPAGITGQESLSAHRGSSTGYWQDCGRQHSEIRAESGRREVNQQGFPSVPPHNRQPNARKRCITGGDRRGTST